jgi:hypothetical protein
VLDPGCVARGGVERGTTPIPQFLRRPVASEWRPLRRFLTPIRWGPRAEPDSGCGMGAARCGSGYVRVSTVDLNTVRQLDGVAVDRVFTDTASGKDANSPPVTAG